MISNGLLPEAIRAADSVLTQLASYINDPAVKAIVVCEPSCLSAMQDDWLQLKLKTPLELRRRLAAKALAVEDFIEHFWSEHPVRPELKEIPESAAHGVVYHGHCHQKALAGMAGGMKGGAESLLQRIAGPQLRILPPAVAGWRGPSAIAAKRYDLSMKIGEQSLFFALAGCVPEATVVAAGTSCRHQIKDGTGPPRPSPHHLGRRSPRPHVTQVWSVRDAFVVREISVQWRGTYEHAKTSTLPQALPVDSHHAYPPGHAHRALELPMALRPDLTVGSRLGRLAWHGRRRASHRYCAARPPRSRRGFEVLPLPLAFPG